MITPAQARLICNDMEIWERVEMIEETIVDGDDDSIPLAQAYQALIDLAQKV